METLSVILGVVLGLAGLAVLLRYLTLSCEREGCGESGGHFKENQDASGVNGTGEGDG